MGKNLAEFKKKCKTLTLVLIVAGAVLMLLAVSASNAANRAYSRYAANASSPIYSSVASSAYDEYSEKNSLSDICVFGGFACAAAGDVAILGWVGCNMLAAMQRDMGTGGEPKESGGPEKPVADKE